MKVLVTAGKDWAFEFRRDDRRVLRVDREGLSRFLILVGLALLVSGAVIASLARAGDGTTSYMPGPAGTRGDENATGYVPVLIVSPEELGTYDALVVTVQSLYATRNLTSNVTVVTQVPDEVALEVRMDRLGLIDSLPLGTVRNTTTETFQATLDWEWGWGTVSATFARANVTLERRFHLVYSDLARYNLDAQREADRRAQHKAEEDAFYGTWGAAFATLFLSAALGGFLAVGYAAHRYHADRGEESWWDALVRWLNVSLERNPLKKVLDEPGYDARAHKEIVAVMKQQELIEELNSVEAYDLPKLRALDRRLEHAILDIDRVHKRGRRVLVVARKQVRLREKEEKLIDRGHRVKRLATDLRRLREDIEADLAELDKEI